MGTQKSLALYLSNQTICVNTHQVFAEQKLEPIGVFAKQMHRKACWWTSLRKEVIQPQVPLGLPCYDFTPVMNHTVVIAIPKVKLMTSGAAHSHGVTGGVYEARERIHRGILIHDY